jgi:hypothetical protein
MSLTHHIFPPIPTSGIAVFVAGAVFLSPLAAEQNPTVEHSLSVGQEFYSATGDQLPLWLHANKFGTVPTDAPVSVTSGSYGVRIGLGEYTTVDSTLDIGFAMSDSEPQFQLRQADIGINWRALELRGGKFPYTRGVLPIENLSVGSLGTSGNAEPLPSVSLSLPESVTVPFTNNLIGIRGGLAHGWFTGERWIQDTLLLSRWAYLNLGNEDSPVQFYGGLVVETMWGGNSKYTSNQPATASLENFARVVLFHEGGDDAPTSDQLNVIGNHLGIWEIGASINLGWSTLSGYHHHIFEDRSGIRGENRFDGLWGLGLELNTTPPWLPDRWLFEYLDTIDQSGPYHDVMVGGRKTNIGGRDSYYHHGQYSNGWTHLGRIIGTPLFVLIGEDESVRIASNRVKAYNWAFSGVINNGWEYRVRSVYVGHFPAYAAASVVPSNADDTYAQWHQYFRLSYSDLLVTQPVVISVEVGADFGRVYEDSIGLGLSIEWSY